MIRTLAVTDELEVMIDIPLERLSDGMYKWYWVDFDEPTEEEAKLLDSHFHFHPLAVEDCFHLLQRPKLDHYEDVHFFVMHAINGSSLAAEEIDLFLGSNYIVTFHFYPSDEIDEAWNKIAEQGKGLDKGHIYATYVVMDKLVDYYFPSVYMLEEEINDIENKVMMQSNRSVMDDIFSIRSKLMKLRRTIVPMRELLYRVNNSDKIAGVKEQIFYFADVHDHLLKLTEIIDANRDLTADIRDSYISMNSNRMNTIMKTLTVITTIFMPLTFIAGVYGMNFEHMPELGWRWGYFAVLTVMLGTGIGMYVWFKRKGWFK